MARVRKCPEAVEEECAGQEVNPAPRRDGDVRQSMGWED